jgi:hypothetical protein
MIAIQVTIGLKIVEEAVKVATEHTGTEHIHVPLPPAATHQHDQLRQGQECRNDT